MKLLKKAISLSISCLLTVSGTFMQLTATAATTAAETSCESVEEAVQAALAIANDDKHGYSMTNRWGPDYDCSSFVITSLKNAGFDTGGAVSTANMKQSLTMKGWKWYPWSVINSLDDLKRGDILLNEKSHTEFYIGRGKDIGAFVDYGHPETGDQTGYEICVSGFYNNPWDGVLRYTNDIPKVKPSDLEISANYDNCAVNQNVYFSFFSINAAEQYLDIYNGKTRVNHINVTDKYHYEMNFSQSGTFTYKLTAKNKVGSVSTSSKKITVFKDKPSEVSVSADKNIYAKGDTITFNLNSKNVLTQTLTVNSYYMWPNQYDVTGLKQYKINAEHGGNYTYYLSAYNPAGTVKTKEQSFTIYDSAPENVSVKTACSVYAAGDEVKFSFSSKFASEQKLVILKNNKPFFTKSMTSRNSHIIQIEQAGNYTYYLSAKNKFGESKSYTGSFSVYDDIPSNVYVNADKSEYRSGEKVNFYIYADNADYCTLSIISDNGYNLMSYLGDKKEYTLSFDNVGVYSYTVTAYNKIGSINSYKGKILVANSKPYNLSLQTDKDSYTVYEPIHFTFDSSLATERTLVIENESFERKIDITNVTEFDTTMNIHGTYKCYLIAKNAKGMTKSDAVTLNVDYGYEVKYDANGGTFTYGIDSGEKYFDEPMTITSDIPVKDGFKFEGWSTNPDALIPQYLSGERYSDNRSATLYAVWKDENSSHTHDYILYDWIWNESHTQAQAVFTCSEIDNEFDESHDEIIDAYITVKMSYPSCTESGERVYTATVTFNGVTYTETFTDELPASGHSYTVQSWKWTGNEKAEARILCDNENSDTTTYNAKISHMLSDDKEEIIYIAETTTQDGYTFSTIKNVPVQIIGNLDDDFKITSSDALMVLRMSVGLESVTARRKALADTDNDNIITSADALQILRASVGLSANERIGKILY